MSHSVVLIFGAGITGYGYKAEPDTECLFALNEGLELALSEGCPAIALPGWSKKYHVHYGRMMNRWLGAYGAPLLGHTYDDYATVFNTHGECDAFWKLLTNSERGSIPKHVFAVARGIHSFRAAHLLKLTRPQRFSHITIERVQAPSRDWRLPAHELVSWYKIIKSPPTPQSV